MTNSVSNRVHAPAGEETVSTKDWIAVIGSAVGAFMAVLDIQITNSSLPNIQGALGAGVDEGSWISTAYLIAEIVTIPLTAYLSRVFSVKRYVLVNAVLFLIFSVACAFSWDLGSMIAFRAAQGFTGGTLIPMSFNIILSHLPPSKQPIGLAIFSITAVFAPAIGPAIGGYLTDNFGWEYIFYLNVIPGILLVALLSYALELEPMQLGLLKKGDWFGILSMAVGLGNLEYVLEEGQRKDWFGSDLIRNSAILAAIGLTIFLIIEFTRKEPLLNLRLLARRNFGLGSLANIALGFALYGSVYLLPLYLSTVQGYSAWQIGQVLIWSGLPQLPITPFVPKLMEKIDGRILMIFGLIVYGLSCLMNAFMSHDYSGPQLTISMIVRAIGTPFIFVPLSVVTTAGIEREQAGSGSALFNMLRNLGGSIGIAACSTFVTQREQFHSTRVGESVTRYSAETRQAQNSIASLLRHRGDSTYVAQVQAQKVLDSMVRREANVMAYNDAFLLVAIVLFSATIGSFFLKKPASRDLAEVHLE
jgi:MFS transporter, DHA2 family, multidrug resistance protein